MAEPKIAIDILVNCQSATSQLKKFNKELNNTVEGGKKATNWLAKGFGRLIGAYLSVKTAQNIINTYRKLDLIRQSLNGLAGGAEAGARQFEYLRREADRTANDFTTIAGKYRNFYAAAKGAGFGEQQTQSMFSGLLTAGRALGADKQSIGGALLAVEQMLSKGRVSMEELRRQLGNAYAGAIQVAARAMGVVPEEFEKLLKKGLSSKEFVPKLTAQFEKEFKDSLKEAVKSLDAEIIRLGNAWQYLTLKLGDSGAGREFAKVIRTITELLASPKLIYAITMIGRALNIVLSVIRYLIQNLGTILWLLAPMALGGALTKLVEVIKGAVTWLAAGNLQLNKTQIMLFRVFLILALIQEIIAFFTPMDGALETAILGKDQSWIKSLGYILSVLLAIDGLMGFKALRGLLSLLKKIPIIGAGGAGARQLMLNLPKAGAISGAGSAAVGTGSVATAGIIGAGLASAVTVSHAKKWGLDPMSLSPYGAAMPMGMPHQITLTKDQPVQQSIMYSPQYQIDATTMTPEQLRQVLDERDRDFWTRIANPVSSLIPNFSGGT